LGNFSVSKFYLKLDKKLILETQNVVLDFKKSKEKSSIKELQQLLSNLNYVLMFFQKIQVEEFKLNDNLITIDLDENHLYVDNKFVNISSDLKIENNVINLDLYSLYLKDTNLTFFGNVKIDLNKTTAAFLGKYNYKDLDGDFRAKASKKIFDFYINTNNEFNSLVFLKDFFRLDKITEKWMYDNVKGKIKLNYLSGKIDLKEQKPIIDSIKGEAVIRDAKIRFHEGIKTVNTPKLTIGYENDTLSFNLEKPIYGNSKIYGSKVYISNLTDLKKGTVYVDLKSDSKLNDDVLEILNAYKIKLPLKQIEGNLDSSLLLKIPYSASKEIEVKGEFKATNAFFNLGTFEFLATSANVVLKDNNVIIEQSHIKHKDMADVNLKLNIDTKSKIAVGEIKINSFEIKKDKNKIVSIKDFNTGINIDFNNDTTVFLDALKTNLTIKKDLLNIDIPELSLIFPYSDILKNINIKNGNLKIDVLNENNINFSANIRDLDFPFERSGEKIKNLNVLGTIKNSEVYIKTNNDDISVVLKEKEAPLLKLNNIDLILSNKSTKGKLELPDIDIKLKNSFLKIDEKHIYETSWANLHIKDSKISFEGESLNPELPILKDGKKVLKLEIRGTLENNLLNITTKDKKLKLIYDISKEKIEMNLEGYDIVYNTDDSQTQVNEISYYIDGKNSNIVINQKHIAKSTNYSFIFEKNNIEIRLNNNSTTFYYGKDEQNDIIMNGSNMDDEFLNALLGKNLIRDGNVSFFASGKNDLIKGVANFKNTKIVDLAILNNLIILINTSPALINPFLAIPSVVGMATTGGFNLNGYRIIEGKVEFSYDFKNKFLDLSKINTKGNGIDFDGFLSMNFATSNVDGKLKLIFFKDYSKIVNYIPVINYVLLGDKKRVDTEVTIYGTLEEPKYKTSLVEEGVSAPINVLKRIFTSPIDLIKSLGGSGDDKEEEEKKEE
jgi:hypothetical protein